jgi:hypothetical protein
MEKDRIIYQLWKILDDIDTISDIVKSDDKVYRRLVEEKQRLRFMCASSEYVDELYKKYYVQPENMEAYLRDVVEPKQEGVRGNEYYRRGK